MLPPKFPYDPNSHRDVVKELMTLSGDDKFKGAIIETKRDWEYEINNTNVREWAKGKLSHPNAGDRLESYKRLMQIWMTLRARKRKVLHPFQRFSILRKRHLQSGQECTGSTEDVVGDGYRMS